MPPLFKRKRDYATGMGVGKLLYSKKSKIPYAIRYGYGRSKYAKFSRVGLGTRRSYANELKNIDTDGIAVPALGVTTAAVTAVNNVVQGITAVTRIGRGTVVRQVEFRLQLAMAATSTLSEAWRVMVVYDTRTNGAAITGATVLEADAIENPYNMANAGRFKILYDKTKYVGTAGPQVVSFYMKKRVSLPVNYGLGNAGTSADISTGGISILVWISGTVGVAVSTLNQNYSRVLFQDS